MRTRIISTLVCSALGTITASSLAHADMIARYECNTVGFGSQEPLGDRPDHTFSTVDYACVAVDGVLKGAVYTGFSAVEWDGPKGTFLVGNGVHRIPGGRVVSQMVEGNISYVMKDGKPVGTESAGKGIVKFASGSFAALAGKALKFTTTPVNPIRFILEFTD